MSYSYIKLKNPKNIIQLGDRNNLAEENFLNQTSNIHLTTSTQAHIAIVLIAVALLGLFFIIVVFKKKV